MAEQIIFDVGGDRCVGYLRRSGRQPSPCVVLCQGFGGTQDTPAVRAAAEAFAAAGFHALTFDYRSFGESGGRPRQVVSIQGQLADVAAAVACARGLDGVDPARIVLWGTSLGGGHVVTAAARDPEIAAVIAQIPFNGFPRRVEGRSTRSTLRLLAVMAEDWWRGTVHRTPRYIKAVGTQGELAVMTGAGAQRAVAGMASPTWRNEVAPRALIEMMRYRPIDSARQVTCPVLVCMGTEDAETTPDKVGALAAAAPQGELLEYPVSHFDFYAEDVRNRVIADQLTFLNRVLG
ncbi:MULTISPECIES: alpha/beta hydrolase [Mycolicibacterium]|uniref:alpha/beta hydrolase n=1 Tax=Mycolicibacterium TaxID=1866885 RepID=UPI0007E97B7D|nr:MULTISPECIES: alpha/beta hydrolase [Mycolicibacterium]OBB26508.1 alpha/beta hydrolase [Mycolicibacterium fortuitum]OBB47306.1 alpha/beta hydrolase [Mycolicibacterium fortuitum]OBB51433.1 alpha/beta hydrolase [Mycolicibacterium fortuitum]OBF80904.1 alpha/beta hydrolase [Mycolicibacterium fortuitum]OBG22433.1 alpha/beta hydrolase [Mycolicibacterium fortuitum]